MAINVSVHKNWPTIRSRTSRRSRMFAVTPFVLVVNPSLPVKSVADLAALAKSQARRLELRVERAGRRGASVRRTDQDHARHRDDARALQGQRAGAQRRGGRPCLADVRRSVVVGAARARRASCARSASPRRSACRSRRSSPPLAEAGLPGFDARVLAHVRGARRHAEADRQPAQCRGRCHHQGARRRRGVRQARLRADWPAARRSGSPRSSSPRSSAGARWCAAAGAAGIE